MRTLCYTAPEKDAGRTVKSVLEVRTVLFGRKSIYSFTVIPYDGEKILQIWGQRQRFGFGRAYCPHQGF